MDRVVLVFRTGENPSGEKITVNGSMETPDHGELMEYGGLWFRVTSVAFSFFSGSEPGVSGKTNRMTKTLVLWEADK